MLKKTVIFLYLAIVIVLGVTTFVEHYQGRSYVLQNYYGAWWFSVLWALLTATGIAWIIRQKMRRWPIVLLHVSFIVILAGAFLTHITSKQGLIHLRYGEPTNEYYEAQTEYGMRIRHLPFTIRLNAFNVEYHSGTMAPADYKSKITIIENGQETEGTISMNNILTYRSYRLFQSSYDEDQQGSILSFNVDKWGCPVTYLGYALLFFSLLYMLVDPKGTFRRLLHSPLLKKAATVLLLLMIIPHGVIKAQPTLPKETAKEFGKLCILYNDRICPIQTFALDFTKKLYGKEHYKDFSAEQVLLGFIFWNDEWSKEPIIKIKGSELRDRLDLPKYCSPSTFFKEDMGGYIIGPYINEFYGGNQDNFHKQAVQIDDKIALLMTLHQGTLLKIFPVSTNDYTTWYAPTDKMPNTVTRQNKRFIETIFNTLYQDALSNNISHFNDVLKDIRTYQRRNSGDSLPSRTKINAELTYNKIPFATILFMFNLTMGFISLFFVTIRLSKNKGRNELLLPVLLFISFLALSTCIILRWIIKSTVPISNGYETMLLIAWFVMLISLITYFKLAKVNKLMGMIVITFGFLISGFALLVSHINQMDPQITHMMPVLNSPLLSIHVCIIMMSFALLSLTFICSIIGLLFRKIEKQLAVLSMIFLYPALTTLGIGIFTGAIWANISWGQYWSWDPKETWALITFMVYAIAVHNKTLSRLNNPRFYHTYMLIAFVTLLMTYFGVNYVLGGMHSYA